MSPWSADRVSGWQVKPTRPRSWRRRRPAERCSARRASAASQGRAASRGEADGSWRPSEGPIITPRVYTTRRMVTQLVVAWGLLAASVVVHAYGVASALGWLRRHEHTPGRLVLWVWLFVRLAGWIVVLHVIEITDWALA